MTDRRASHIPLMSHAPAGFSLAPQLDAFDPSLPAAFTPRRRQVIADRHAGLQASGNGKRPDYLPPSDVRGLLVDPGNMKEPPKLRQARRPIEETIRLGRFDPI